MKKYLLDSNIIINLWEKGTEFLFPILPLAKLHARRHVFALLLCQSRKNCNDKFTTAILENKSKNRVDIF